jgi:LCP family protein required for cell wall assembly
VNILLLGSDRRGSEQSGRADAIILAILFPDVPAVNLLSIPRDLFVYVPGRGMGRINTAHAFGGLELLKATLRYNLGLRVDYYVRADFEGFRRIVDTLGGIDVPVDCRLEDWRADSQNPGAYIPFALEPGVRHLDGELALWYVRSRQTTSGFDRDRRQHKVLRAAWHKALQLDAIPKIPELWGAVSDAVQTDLSLLDVVRLGAVGVQLDTGRIKSRSINSAHVVAWTAPDGQQVILPIWEKLEPVLRDTLTPGQRSATSTTPLPIELWNGTGVADWPVVAADRMADEGFAAVLAETDRHDYAQTFIVDFGTGNSEALQRLRTLFHVAPQHVIRHDAPSSAVPYRVVIGGDFNVCARPGRPLPLTPTPTPTPTASPMPTPNP